MPESYRFADCQQTMMTLRTKAVTVIIETIAIAEAMNVLAPRR